MAVLVMPALAQAQAPLSAIDWLTEPVPVTTRVVPRPTPQTSAGEPPVARTAIVPEVSVTELDRPGADAVGLLPSNVTGLPANLWQNSQSRSLSRALHAQDVLGLPAMQSLLYTLLLAEAEPPMDAGTGYTLLQSRIAKLMELGAVEPAQALLDRAGPENGALFPLWFDISLLTGTEEAACDALNRSPHLSRDIATRVFCVARGGDWNAAAVMLETSGALGLVKGVELSLLRRFLEPELIEEGGDLPPPADVTPLVFRLFEAAGTPLPTTSLPRAFAMADLRDTAGWKAELAAAERLSRTGALSENRLFAYYTARHPAASGGIWDRVEAIQRFDTAIRSGDPGAVAAALPRAWAAMQQARLEVPFARYYADRLVRLPLTGAAHPIAFAVGLLSPGYEAAATRMTAESEEERFLAALARGEPQAEEIRDPLSRAITRAFERQGVPPSLDGLLQDGKLGEGILAMMALFDSGTEGDFGDLETALAGFRSVGLEDTARRAALQLMLMNQGG